jgi:glycosyltransferase involved in cell wall biosynthesis
MKQVKELLSVIPALHQALNGIAEKDLHFFILGHGSLEGVLKQTLTQSKYKGLPVTIAYSNEPEEILKQSKFFFSLQLHNNFPSRSLIEAMAAGNIPIVTDVGKSRWLAKPEFSFYVPEHFSEKDILHAGSEIFCEGEKSLAEKSRMARQFVVNEHTVEKMRDYYLSLYDML